MTELIQELFAVTNILKGADQKEIEHKRCFVVSHANFWRIVSFYKAVGWDVEGDERLAANGYNNLHISLSVADKHTLYFVCEEAQPMLDEIWKETK